MSYSICKKLSTCFCITGKRTCYKIKELCPMKLERCGPGGCQIVRPSYEYDDVFEEIETTQNQTVVKRIPREFIIP